jgi:hypothetical protein
MANASLSGELNWHLLNFDYNAALTKNNTAVTIAATHQILLSKKTKTPTIVAKAQIATGHITKYTNAQKTSRAIK